MSNYVPVKVSHKRQKQLSKEGAWCIFWRLDSEGQYWVKAAMKQGEQIMKSYGIDARNETI